MRKRQPKPGQVGNHWLTKKPGRDGIDDAWCNTWYDGRTRQTRRVSLGTADFQEASLKLANWTILNERPNNADPRDVLIEQLLLTYWEGHGKNVPSASTLGPNLALWQKFWAGKTVADITPNEQRRFKEWLAAGDRRSSTIDKILTAGRAALNRAVKWQELSASPHIFHIETSEEKRSRKPKGRPITPEELAKLLDAITQPHMFIYVLIAANTFARPGAILDLCRSQFDEKNMRLDLNPAGRVQNKKHRPILAVTPTLRNWLLNENDPDAHYVYRRERRLKKSRLKAFRGNWVRACKDAGLDGGITPYSVRHGMAREMRKRSVPTEQISFFLGHLPKGSDATTAIYAPYEPDYCIQALAAIEDVMATVRKLLTRANIDDPQSQLSALELQRPKNRGRGALTDEQREELRTLIVSPMPMKEIARVLGVSNNTVTTYRKSMGLPDQRRKPAR